MSLENIAALRALSLTRVNDGERLYVSGYYSENDGGGGIFIYDSTSAATDNGGSVIAPNESTGRYLAVFGDTVPAKRFGAKGDGSTNDTAAINKAIAFANGKAVFFDSGTYAVVQSGASAIAIDAGTVATLKGNPGKSIIKLTSASGAAHIIGSDDTVVSIEIDGITLDATGIATDVWGVYVDDIAKLVSRNNTFSNLTKSGVSAGIATLAENILSQHDSFTGITEHGVQVYNSRTVTVENGFFNGFVKSAVDTNPLAAGTSDEKTKVRIANNVVVCDAGFAAGNSVLSLMGDDVECCGNKISGGAIGIVVHSGSLFTLKNYSVYANTIRDTSEYSISVSSDVNANVCVFGNSVYGSLGDGIRVANGFDASGSLSASVSIVGNTIELGSGSAPAWTNEKCCIHLYDTANVVIGNNVCRKGRFAGIMVADNARNISITGNLIEDHQGEEPSDLAGSFGAAIYIGQGGEQHSISVSGNVIENYLVTASGGTTNARSGGIVVLGDGADASNFSEISIVGNSVSNGNGIGIQVAWASGVVVSSNAVSGYYSAEIAQSNNTSIGNGRMHIVLPNYADNAAAVSGGLSIGDLYRTTDAVKIVHA